jgi:uncharacterized membrane protein YadS
LELTMSRIAWLGPAVAGLGAIVKSYLTGPDGRSYAPGRLFAFATFVIAQGLVVRVSAALLPVMRHASDWMTFFMAVAGFQAATGATCIALVLGIAPADSGGKWWSKDASPPPKI